MDEHGVKIRYAQPQATTSFMVNRKIAMPKKSISGVSQQNNNFNATEPTSAERDVTPSATEGVTGKKAATDASPMNADLDIEKMQNSAIFNGLSSLDRSSSPKKEAQSSERGTVPLSLA